MHGIEVGDELDDAARRASIVAGIGIGMTNPGIASVAIGVVDAARAGMASGINSTFRQVGIATGTAALGAIFQSRIDSKLGELLPQAPDGVLRGRRLRRAQSALAAVPPQLREQAADAANQAFVSGLNEILLVGAAIALRRRDRRLAAGPPPRHGRAARAEAPAPGEPERARAGCLQAGGANPSAPAAKTGGCCTSCGSRTCC